MLIPKYNEMAVILDWFEREHGSEDYWDIDMMLDWVGSDKYIMEHPGLPTFIAFWCDSDLGLYAEFANEFHHRWPGLQAKFDYLAKNTSFSVEKDCWEIYN